MNKSAMQWMVEPFHRYADFSGRARRAEYWWFTLFVALVSIALAIIDALLFDSTGQGVRGVGILGALFSLAILLPSLAVAVRRLHDIGRTGWWLLLPFAAVIVLAFVSLELGRLGGGGSFIGNVLIVLVLVALLGIVLSFGLLLVWACTRGTDGFNRFGADPVRHADLAEVFD